MNDNESFVSSSDIQDRQVELTKENKSQDLIDENEVQLYSLKLEEKAEKAEKQMNLEEFK